MDGELLARDDQVAGGTLAARTPMTSISDWAGSRCTLAVRLDVLSPPSGVRAGDRPRPAAEPTETGPPGTTRGLTAAASIEG